MNSFNRKLKIKTKKSSLPVVLSVAGSDNSAGAGAQADLKTMSALGTYGVTAITCVVAEVPGKVSAIEPVSPRLVAEQIRLLFGAFPIAAVKTGMLYSAEIIAAVADALAVGLASGAHRPSLVVDPVMVATSGDLLLQPDAVALYEKRLFPMATLVTPNLDEVSALVGRRIESAAALREAGEELVQRHCTAFLLKGAHLRGPMAVDLLISSEAGIHEFRAPYIDGVATHGTGCTLSAAIASGLAHGLALRDAVEQAKAFVGRALAHFLRWKHGNRTTDALHHFAPRARRRSRY